MAMEAAPSHTGDPVTCRRISPSAASTRPTIAAESSNRAVLTVVSGLLRTWSSNSVWLLRASRRYCTSTRTRDVPSATAAAARTR